MEGHEGSGQHGPVVALGLVLPLVEVESLHLGVVLGVEHSGHEFRKALKKQQPKIYSTVSLASGQIGRTLAVELPTRFTNDVKRLLMVAVQTIKVLRARTSGNIKKLVQS